MVGRKVIVGDAHDDVVSVIREAIPRADLVILTGGLGATDEKNVRVYVGYLRGKLENTLPSGTLFETVRGFGYVLRTDP